MALQADRDSERAVLIRLIDSIERLEPLIARAERESDPQVRVQFRYDWLRRDLAEVKTGLEAYLMEAEFAPRSFEPLQAEYHQ
ncbi:MAG: conjugal transfer protein [Gammaproteobacteria bacterium]|nr:conjugal transfer protein [Gammaproteobacteria bacterium]